MSDSMRNWVNNLGTVILALLLAFVVWITAKLADDPFTTQQFTNVPLEVLNMPKDTVLYESITGTGQRDRPRADQCAARTQAGQLRGHSQPGPRPARRAEPRCRFRSRGRQ